MKVKDFILYLQQNLDQEKHIVIFDNLNMQPSSIVLCKNDEAPFYILSPIIEGLVTIEEFPITKEQLN